MELVRVIEYALPRFGPLFEGRKLAQQLGFHIFCVTRPCGEILDDCTMVDVVGGLFLLWLLLGLCIAVSRRDCRQQLAAPTSVTLALLIMLGYLQSASPCRGCPTMLFLNCPLMVDHGTFHRLWDCFLPRYAELRLLNATRCVVTSPGETGLYVSALLSDYGFRAVDPTHATCTHHRWPRTEMGNPSWGHDWDPGRLASGRRSTSSAHVSSLAVLHKDIQHRTGPSDAPWIVLVTRRPPASRAFDDATTARLHAALANIRTHRVKPYFGNESQQETMALFANAAAVVGFHGAGFVNTIFPVRRCCVIEISTTRQWRPTNRGASPNAPLQTMVWRSNLEVADANRNLEWHVINISLAQIAARNDKPADWVMHKNIRTHSTPPPSTSEGP